MWKHIPAVASLLIFFQVSELQGAAAEKLSDQQPCSAALCSMHKDAAVASASFRMAMLSAQANGFDQSLWRITLKFGHLVDQALEFEDLAATMRSLNFFVIFHSKTLSILVNKIDPADILTPKVTDQQKAANHIYKTVETFLANMQRCSNCLAGIIQLQESLNTQQLTREMLQDEPLDEIEQGYRRELDNEIQGIIIKNQAITTELI